MYGVCMKKKTQEEYIEELKNKNPNVILLGDYDGYNNKTTHYCLLHNEKWEVKPASVLHGAGCEKCRIERFKKTKTKTHMKYLKDIEKVNPYIIPIDNYIDAKTPIRHFCTLHSITWEIMPTNILAGNGCKECLKEKISKKNRKTQEQYIIDLFNKNSNIILIGKYINALVPTRHKCLLCGNEWDATPGNILYGVGCPKCQISHGERKISDWLEMHNFSFLIQYKFKDCVDKRPLPFDFYLPNNNTCIEYDGQQHFYSVDYFGGEDAFIKRQRHDKIKNDYCKNNNISLLRISYKDNIEEQLYNFLFI